MKNYKVEATMKFTDKEENVKRNVGDIFETTKERYEFLKKNNAVKLIEIVEEPKKSMIFVDTKNESENIKPLDEEKIKKIADEMIEHIKPKKKKSKKK